MTVTALDPIVRSAEELETQLSDPVEKAEAARVMNVAVSTIYASCHRFLAAKKRGDITGMRDNIPCLKLGDGTYRIPRGMFIAFWTCAGLSRETLLELYGEQVARDLFGDDEDGRAA